MEASSENQVLTPDHDQGEDLTSFRERAREMLQARRDRLLALQKQITEQTRSIAGDLEQERARLDTEQSSIEAHRAELQQQLDHLETLQHALAGDRSEWDTHQTSVIERQEKLLTALAEQYERLEAVREDLAAREESFHEQQLRFEHEQSTFFSLQLQQAEREEQLDTAARQLKSGEEELLGSQQELAQRQADLQEQIDQLNELKAECEQRQREASSLQEQTQRQRKQIAAQLRQSRAEAIAEVERRKAEIDDINQADDGQLRRELELAQQQCHDLRDDIATREGRIEEFQRQLAKAEEQHANAVRNHEQADEARRKAKEELGSLRQQLEDSLRKHDVYQSKLEDRLAQLNELREENQKLRQAATADGESLAAARGELERFRGQAEVLQQQHTEARETLKQKEEEIKRLQQAASEAGTRQDADIALRKQIEQLNRERQELQAKLDSAQQEIDSASHGAGGNDQELQQRLEATTQEIRELKQTNRDLQEKLKSNRGAQHSPHTGGSDDAQDWESQKRRLLAQLEDEGEDEQITPARQSERLKIEETIRITDRALAEKEQELNELRQLLDNQSSNIGEVAVGANAIAAMLDSDELIREERESLKHIQAQWREKLRQAELDVSVERANLARERSELDEKIEQFEKHRAKLEQELRDGGADPAKKPNKRKWMDRLGIKADE
jgi:chromosome segregation ATPase